MGLLDDRVALVAGVGPDLGAALCRAFAREGAHVALAARGETTIRPLAAELQGLGVKTVWRTADVTDPEACRALVERVETDLGRLDVLVNNAYTTAGEGPLADADLDGWREALDVNFMGAVTLTQAAIPALRRAGEGRVIMVSTIGSRDIQPGAGPYAASKSALNTLTKTLARELGPDGIRVNALLPGWIWGPTAEATMRRFADAQGITFEDMHAGFVASTSLGYLPDADEVARVGVYLASDLSRPVTGHLLDANAGQWM